ncbi:choice-of-anchor R domain-containing protein [Congregibacter variabilis]|uniref:Choice-of-anchor R domain-containing protein n=1 Tax=Congregibacter variabilis TaxID=3081200 RepID=A0ABZ0I6E4_9GAMM|nr:choice-of-anchor R domain-containing protein [Congregibacter sp. IMCC43200]
MSSAGSHALGTQVLSNFNQVSSGVVQRLGVSELIAIPFVTDGSYTEFDGVMLTATTLFGPGLFFVEIWGVDAFAQPANVVATLAGPSAPSGLSSYTGSLSLLPNTSYFLVLGIRNGGSQIQLDTIDGNGTDAAPAPIYQFGTDTTGDDSANLVNKCVGTRANDFVTISWNCGGPIVRRFFPKVQFVAEQLALSPNFSLTASPLSVDFGLVVAGSSSSPVLVTIENDGSVDQPLGLLTVGARFALANDNCSSTTLTPEASCTVEVIFTPDHGGLTTGTLIIPATNDPVATYGLPLAGQSDDPVTVLPPFAVPRAVPLPITMTTVLGLIVLLISVGRLRLRSKGLRAK